MIKDYQVPGFFSIGRYTAQILAKPRFIKTALLAGSSFATVGFFKQPALELIDNFKAVTPTKVNIVLGVGILLLMSNAYFAYKYYLSSQGDGDSLDDVGAAVVPPLK